MTGPDGKPIDPMSLLRAIDGKVKAVTHKCGKVLLMRNVLWEEERRLGCKYQDPNDLANLDGIADCPECLQPLVNFYDDKHQLHFRKDDRPTINLDSV